MFRVLQFLLAIFVLGLFLSGGCINRRDRMDSNAAPSDAALPNPQRVSQWDEKDALTVPFEFNAASEGAPAVWLRLNGGKSRLFVVDTGCKPPLILWEETARALHLQRRSKEARRSEKDDSDFHLCSVSLRCVSARKRKIVSPFGKNQRHYFEIAFLFFGLVSSLARRTHWQWIAATIGPRRSL